MVFAFEMQVEEKSRPILRNTCRQRSGCAGIRKSDTP